MTDNLLVSTQWLADHLQDTSLRVVDIRGHVLPASEPPPHYFNHYRDYLKSHIPGAVFIDWVYEITDPDSLLHARIAPPERFVSVMSRVAVGDNTFVVAYDDAAGMFAARLWWALNYYGHTQVSVLDGGWNKWVAENRLVDAEIPVIRPTEFTPHLNSSLMRSGDDVLKALNTQTKIVDSRSREEFAGQFARAQRKGHIPGAVNQPRTELVAPDGTMLPPEQLRARFAALDVDENTPEIITYCNAGVSASYEMLALQVAGFQNVAVYDGSWKDWGNDETKPIEVQK